MICKVIERDMHRLDDWIYVDVNITGVTLLSAEEYLRHKRGIRALNGDWWWLRGPKGHFGYLVSAVFTDGTVVVADVNHRSGGVRPVLLCEGSRLQSGDKVKLFGLSWRVLEPTMLLCDELIGHRAFYDDLDEDGANNYETSDVKRFLEDWFKMQAH